ncbi:MAG: VOC family protein [Pyrinomonadaceae bacterium]
MLNKIQQNEGAKMETPDYYLPIMPYLIVEKANEFIEFIKEVFGAEEKLIAPREDGTIMHAEFSLGKATIMFAAANETYKSFPCGMFVLREDVDTVYHKALARGAVSLQELGEHGYGRSGGFQDKSGNQWWVTKLD